MPKIKNQTCPHCKVIFTPYREGMTYCSRPCYRDAGAYRRENGDGYVLVWAPDHPKAYASGQQLEHRLVMEKVLGRYLTEDESVHHKDGNRRNNKEDNLELRVRYHGKGATSAHCQTCSCFDHTP